MGQKKYITSIDEVLEFLDVQYDPSLPVPELYEGPTLHVPIVERGTLFGNLPAKAMERRYVKEEIAILGPNGDMKRLIVWKEI